LTVPTTESISSTWRGCAPSGHDYCCAVKVLASVGEVQDPTNCIGVRILVEGARDLVDHILAILCAAMKAWMEVDEVGRSIRFKSCSYSSG
jgi:hypothetical protein